MSTDGCPDSISGQRQVPEQAVTQYGCAVPHSVVRPRALTTLGMVCCETVFDMIASSMWCQVRVSNQQEV
jgi:hypothetical protein